MTRRSHKRKLNLTGSGDGTVTRTGVFEMNVRGGGGAFLRGWEDDSDDDEHGHIFLEREDGDKSEGMGNELKENDHDECSEGGNEGAERCTLLKNCIFFVSVS